MSVGPSHNLKMYKGYVRGLNNLADGTDLSNDELAKASNIDLDDDGNPSRRKGQTSVLAGNFTSLWSDKDTCLAVNVTARALVQIFTDYTTATILTGVDPARRMVYGKVLDKIYYTNGQIIGYLQGNGNYSLPTPVGEYKATLPPGEFLKLFNNRLYVGTGNKLIMSDVGEYSQYDERFFGRQFGKSLTLLEAVNDGLFVADDKTYFIGVMDPLELKQGAIKDIAPYGAIKHASLRVDGSLLVKGKTVPGKIVYWASEEGICFGTDGGEFGNYTRQRYELPDGQVGAALLRKNHKGTNQVIITIAQ